MKLAFVIVLAICGFNTYAVADDRVYYFEVPVLKEVNDLVNALGGVSDVVRPAVYESAKTLSQAQYLANVALKNLNDSFGSFESKKLLENLRTDVFNMMAVPSWQLRLKAMTLLSRAIEIQKSIPNVDTQLGSSLKAAIEEGTQCVQSMGVSVGSALTMRTGIVAVAAQKKKDLFTLPHLLENQMKMVVDDAKTQVQLCLATFDEKSTAILNAIRPQEPVVLPANIGAAGSNLAGIEESIRQGVKYVLYLVPDFLVNSLNKLNGLGNFLKPTLEGSSNLISDARFEMAKALDAFNKTISFAYARNREMAIDFEVLSNYTLNKMQQPIGEMREFITNLVKSAVPLLTTTPLPQAPAIFAKTIPVFQEAILSATACITKMGTYSATGISTAQSTVVAFFHSGHLYKNSKGNAVEDAKALLASLYSNIQKITDEAADNVADCMEPAMNKATATFAKMQKEVAAATSVPAPAPSQTVGPVSGPK